MRPSSVRELWEGVPTETKQALWEWKEANEERFVRFTKKALERYAAGDSRLGAKEIVEAIRKDDKDLGLGDDGWKMNNTLAPYLSRLAASYHPELLELFEFRAVRGAKILEAA